MKRRIMATLLMVGALTPAGVAAASQTANPTGKQVTVWSIVQQHSLSHLVQGKISAFPGRSLSRLDSPSSEPRATGKEGVPTLRVPDAAFSPGTVNNQYDGVEDNAHADLGDFALFHSASYSSLGRGTGYLERADWTPAGASSPAYFYYQASTFDSNTIANNVYQDGVNHVKSATGQPPTDCTSALQTPCSIMGYSTTEGTYGAYVAFQYNQCLVEVDANAPQSVFTAQSDQMAKTAGTITSAAFAVVKSACSGAAATAPKPTPVPSKNTVSYRAPTNLWPSGTQVSKDYVPTNTDDLFKLFHPTTSMTQLGRVADQGYIEGVVWMGTTKQKSTCGKKTCTKKVSFTVSMMYMASVFPSASQASAAFNDGKQQFQGAQDASNLLPTKLGDQMYTFIGSSKTDGIGALAFQRGNVTVEMLVVTKKKFVKQLSQGVVYLDQVGQWLDGQARQQS